MKAYTDLEQSKKLAEILPIESADMCWCNNFIRGINYTDNFSANLYTVKEMKDVFDEALVGWDKYWELVPCWSLAALLDLIPDEEPLLQKIEGTWTLTVNRDEEHLDQFSDKTLIGTLYEAIKWLVENNYIKKNV